MRSMLRIDMSYRTPTESADRMTACRSTAQSTRVRQSAVGAATRIAAHVSVVPVATKLRACSQGRSRTNKAPIKNVGWMHDRRPASREPVPSRRERFECLATRSMASRGTRS